MAAPLPHHPPNFRYRYTNADVAMFHVNGGPHGLGPKFAGMMPDPANPHNIGRQVGPKFMRVVTQEDIMPFLLEFYNDPATGYQGRDKLMEKIKNTVIGIGKREISAFLHRNEVHERYQPLHDKIVNRPIIIKSPFKHMQIDLTNWWPYRTFNQNNAYLLSMVDLNTKMLWCYPQKNKLAATTAESLEGILTEIWNKYHVSPSVIQSDQGGEFGGEVDEVMKNHGIKHIKSLSHNPSSNGAIERLQGSLKKMIKRYMTQHNTRRWLDILPQVVENYNNTKHRVTGHTPLEMIERKAGEHDDSALQQRQENGFEGIKKQAAGMLQKYNRHFPELVVGDWVRISITLTDAEQRKLENEGHRKGGSVVNWTRELYRITAIHPGHHKNHLKDHMRDLYKLVDENDHPVKGRFYRFRLLKAVSPDMIVNPELEENDDFKKLDDDFADEEEDQKDHGPVDEQDETDESSNADREKDDEADDDGDESDDNAEKRKKNRKQRARQDREKQDRDAHRLNVQAELERHRNEPMGARAGRRERKPSRRQREYDELH